MRPHTIRPLLATTALVFTPVFTLALSAPAFAQEVVDDAEASVAEVAADSTDDGAIYVTARRREEQSQDIPLAISVVDGEQLDNTGAFNVGRLQQLTPTVQYYSSNPRNTSLSIRGIGAPFGLTNDGFEQGVGIYVDDIYYSRVASATFDFLDVAQIEVLRGPQGTLYGKNTTAGAINIQTNQPSFDLEGRVEATIGNLGFKQVKAALSGPLSDNVAARLAVSGTSRRGTIFKVATGTYINEQDNIGLRGQVLWQPSDTLDVTLSGDYSTQNPECCGTVYVRTGATQRPLYRQYEALAAAQNYAPPSRDPFDRLTDIDADLSAKNEIGGVGLRAQWELGDGTLTSATAWRFWNWGPANDRDFTGLPITTRSQNPSQQNQYTQELRYNYSAGNVDAVIGLFGFHQTVRTQGTESLGSAASRWLLNPGNVPVGSAGCATPTTLACDPTVLDGVVAYNDIRLDNTSAALFGQVSWEVSPGLTLQPGVRLNWDKKDGLYERLVFDGAGSPVTFRDAAGNLITNPRVVAQRDALTPQRIEPTFSDWNFSYDFTASYQFTPEVLGYATYAKSFKSGGINLNGVPNDAQGNPQVQVGAIRPENVNHYEIGIKTDLPGRLGVFNLAAFRTDIGDYQALVNAGQVSTTRGYLANAEKVRTQGFEADLNIQPSDRFRAYVNAAYTDAKYVAFTGAPCPPELSGGGSGAVIAAPGTPGNSPASCDISGQRIAGVSKWSLSYGAEANAEANLLGRAGEIYFGFDGNYRSRFSSNPSPSAYTWIDGYSLANFRLGFRTDDGLNVFAWVRNAFDEEFFELLSVAPGSTGLIAGQPGDPRTYGLTLAHNF
jgi:iron complex outermembrane receptor protein